MRVLPAILALMVSASAWATYDIDCGEEDEKGNYPISLHTEPDLSDKDGEWTFRLHGKKPTAGIWSAIHNGKEYKVSSLNNDDQVEYVFSHLKSETAKVTVISRGLVLEMLDCVVVED